MRKRSRGRAVANRGGGRGAAAGSTASRSTRGGKGAKSSPFPLRQSSAPRSPPSSTIKFITRDSGEPPPPTYLNGAHTRNLQQQQQNGTELKRNGLAVNSIASIMESATAAVHGADFYLHKKFKKVSSAVPADDQFDQDANVEKGAVAVTVDRKRKNGTVAPPPSLILDIASNLSNKTQFSSETQRTSATSFFSIHNSNEIPPSRSSISSTSPSLSNDIVTKPPPAQEPTVYKPKFHKLLLSEEPTRKLSYDSRLAAIQQEAFSKVVPFQPFSSQPPAPAPTSSSSSPGKTRIDRQSLDDRISKIIDENQSILATLPEYSTRRKSHHNSGGSTGASSLTSSPRNSRSSLTSMSGSSSIEYEPRFGGGGAFDLSVRKTSLMDQSAPKPKTILVRSQSDLSESLVLRNLHLMSPSPSSLSLPPSDAAGKYLPEPESFVVPKKRRKLSPGVFCGGEVSEVKQEEVKYKNPSQDVDMTVRVSNCSGAKVTVRATTSTSASRKISLSTSSGGYVSVMGSDPANRDYQDHKIVMEQPSGLSTFSPLISPNIFAQHQQEQVIDLKVVKGRSNAKNGVVRKNSEPPARVAAPPPPPARKFSAMPPQAPIDLKKEPVKREYPATLNLTKPRPAPVISLAPPPPPSLVQSANISACDTDKKEDTPKRPNFLPLRPVNQTLLKKSCFDSSLVLPSPDTPRGAKPTNQVYNNGHAYTYLGFKVSTRSSYTCLFRPQPMFVPQENDPKLSMYSNWQPRPKDPNAPLHDLSTNDSWVNNKSSTPPSPPFYSTASENTKDSQTTIVSSSKEKQPSPVLSTFDSSVLAWVKMAAEGKRGSSMETEKEPSSSQLPSTSRDHLDRKEPLTIADGPPPAKKHSHQESRKTSNTSDFSSVSTDAAEDEDSTTFPRQQKKSDDSSSSSSSSSLLMIANRLSEQAAARSAAGAARVIEGGFESNEDYTYVRGRGRGRYVCEACGIRCKKPSMLRKHLKTHTDLRPYTCKLCNFSFKTKGNLTKHQKSKSHHKKCFGLGIDPKSSQSLAMIGPTSMMSDDEEDDSDDSEEDEDEEEMEDSSSQDSFEKEIAQSLLDLSRVGQGPSSFQQQQPSEGKTDQPMSLAKSTPPQSSSIPATESPIDLSVKPPSAAGSSQKPNPEVLKFEMVNGIRPIGLVAEAQRWEEDEQQLANGCLNLTKVLNKNVVAESSKSATPPPPPVIEFKVEKDPPQQQKMVATVRPYEFEITRRRLSKSCSDINPASSSKSIPAAAAKAAPPKLHQPWLSPTATTPASGPAAEEEEDEEVDSGRERTESYSSTTTSESKDDLDNNNVEAASSSSSQELRSIDLAKKPTVGLIGLRPQAEFREPSGAQAMDGGKAECTVCGKVFARGSQLTLHMNIHYLERPFRCDPCGVSFRTKGHLIKHRRSSSHDCKVYLTEAWGVANEENPRPFKCADCKIAFRIHGHLAKHLRSKMHIMRMECLGKLPFGIYFEMEKSGMNLNEIDTTDCDMSLVSLQNLAKKIYGESWEERLTVVDGPDGEQAQQPAAAAAVQ